MNNTQNGTTEEYYPSLSDIQRKMEKKNSIENILSKMYACIQLKNSMSTRKIEIMLFYVTSNALNPHEKQQL